MPQKHNHSQQICSGYLLSPLARASEALARLDERLAYSPVGTGLIERFHFADSCAWTWLDNELVEMEDLVLHDVERDTRSPSHAPTIACGVLQTRRRIVAQVPDWALSTNGLRSLRPEEQACIAPFLSGGSVNAQSEGAAVNSQGRNGEGVKNRLDNGFDLPGIHLDAIDAVLAPSDDVLAKVQQTHLLVK